MLNNWQTKQLRDICYIGAGNSAPQRKELFSNGTYPFFRTSDVGKIHVGVIFESADYLNDRGIKGLKLFNKGTILFPKSGASTFLNHRVVLGVDGYVSSHLATITTVEKLLNSRFLFYFLQEIQAQNLIQDHKYPSLNLPIIGDIEISYPESLAEQRRIVKILDEVFGEVAKAKENAEKNLKNSKELFESYLQSVFEKPAFAKGSGVAQWEEKRLDEVCEISSKLVDPRKKEYLDLIHVGGGNIEANKGTLVDLKTAREEKLISGKFIFDESMVLYSKIRPYLMKVVRPDFIGLCSADIYPLSPLKGKIVRDYLFYLLLSKSFTQYAVKGSGRAGMPKVNREHLFAYRFFVPSISEQKAIVKKLDALSAETKELEGIYAKKLADLEELKKSVLRKAFAGEL